MKTRFYSNPGFKMKKPVLGLNQSFRNIPSGNKKEQTQKQEQEYNIVEI